MGQKTGTGQSAGDRSRRCRRLDDPVAAAAGVLGPNVTDDAKSGGNILQQLRSVFAQWLEWAAAVGANSGIGLMDANVARQVRREGARNRGGCGRGWGRTGARRVDSMVDFGRAGFQLFQLEFEWVEARARSL